ncbi:nucleotidyltransferase family protein [Agrobacterium sp. lyk4-40-TYG-31]|uniref:nucleotidyltransferase family protein n=1 Tax=Agrobacterium sp. lyk4-40-TYG-31 TaxID=3040276 RepID=UPI002549D5FB|nr:nucleotidyltransferase family protein [Agrobacterium sp. lyk4-40-TYG-31]
MAVAIVLLAAGMSSRTSKNGTHKLLALFDGVPLLRKVAMQAVASRASSVIAVLGYRHSDMENVLSGLDVETVINSDYASGMSRSLDLGFSTAVDRGFEGIMVMLADMPGITGGDLDRMIDAFETSGGVAIIRASAGGHPGNPVILPRSMAGDVDGLEGDVGARHLIKASGLPVIDIDIGDAALGDVDTLEEVTAAGGILIRSNTTL